MYHNEVVFSHFFKVTVRINHIMKFIKIHEVKKLQLIENLDFNLNNNRFIFSSCLSIQF